MTSLVETIAAGLERSREVTAQVAKHLADAHGVAREQAGVFLTDELPRLEDYEVDLILAPLFTPTLNDQAMVAELLERKSIPPEQWPALVQQLMARPTRAQLHTEDGRRHLIPLRAVTIERFVHRLRLNGTITAEVFQWIGSRPQPGDRALLRAIARRGIWEQPGRGNILMRYLQAAGDAWRVDDAVALLRLMETYEPVDAAELRARIPHWQQVLQQELNGAGAKPFFNERVEELHGGGRDQRRPDHQRVSARENELTFLKRLQQALT